MARTFGFRRLIIPHSLEVADENLCGFWEDAEESGEIWLI